MKLNRLRTALLAGVASLFAYTAQAQCIQIESILVDACDPNGNLEGLNEMVRFKVGNAPINLNQMDVEWPTAANNFQGLIRNSVTAQKVAELNASITAAGGCGQLIEPTGNTIPAGSTVILVTSQNMDTASNSFGALMDTIYIIFQNNPSNTTGNFANYGQGNRTLEISFGSNCVETVTYNRSLLIDQQGGSTAQDGATVNFTPAGAATYTNSGCSAPVQPFEVEIDPVGLTYCSGQTVNLSGSWVGATTATWSAPVGSFTSTTANTTQFTIPTDYTGALTITLAANNACGGEVTDAVTLQVNAPQSPNFPATYTLCAGDTAPVLATTSPNGITGTWAPATVSNTTSGTYTFTPDVACATEQTITVTITNGQTPDFPTAVALCAADAPYALATTSPNGITGTWSPATVDMNVSGVYTFTPNVNCATTVQLAVTINPVLAPTFPAINWCEATTDVVLPTVSENGIEGTWSAVSVNPFVGGTFVFTPTEGQCATAYELEVQPISAPFAVEVNCNGNQAVYSLVADQLATDYIWKYNGQVVATGTQFNAFEFHAQQQGQLPYTIQVSAANDTCGQEQIVQIVAVTCQIPKGVSVNGDQLNDTFNLTGLSVEELQIFNRYGMQVYSKTNYTNEWHGQSKDDKELPDGTYYYVIKQSNGDVQTGWVYLIRNS